MKFLAADYWHLLWFLIPLGGYFFYRKSQYRPTGKWLLLAIKAIIFLALLAAAAHPHMRSRGVKREIPILFFLDISKSIPEATIADNLKIIRGLISLAEGRGYHCQLQVFRNRPQLVYATGSEQNSYFPADVTNLMSRLDKGLKNGHRSNYGAVLRKIRALTPDRALIFGDGQVQGGPDRHTILSDVARSPPCPIHTVPLIPEKTNFPRLLSIIHPRLTRMGENNELTVGIDNPSGRPIHLKLTGGQDKSEANGEGIGEHSFTLPFTLKGGGLHWLKLESQLGDASQIHRVPIYSQKTDSLLILSRTDRERDAWRPLLDKMGIPYETKTGAELNGLPPDFSRYSCVVLNNLPRKDLPEDWEERIHDGLFSGFFNLFMLGNNQSFGPGGYSGSRIEKGLPVYTPPYSYSDDAGIILVLDTSGSMQGQPIAALKSAAKNIIAKSSGKTIGIIVFGSQFSVLWPLKTIPQDTREVEGAIDSIYPYGGTLFTPPLVGALKMFQNSGLKKKNVILLSDGSPGDFNQLLYFYKFFHGENMTISTISFGHYANKNILQSIAFNNNGQFYDSTNLGNLEKDLEKEFERISGPAFRTGHFTPRAKIRADPLFIDIKGDPFAPIDGFVGTAPKPHGIIPATIDGVPFIAYGNYGLGKSLVLATDLHAWGRNLVLAAEFPQLFSNLLRLLAPQDSHKFQSEVHEEDDFLILRIYAFDEAGFPQSDLKIVVKGTTGPNALPVEYLPRETKLGVYESRIPKGGEETFAFEIFDEERKNHLLTRANFNSIVSQPEDERRWSDYDRTLLESLAKSTGGIFNPPLNSALFLPPDDRVDFENGFCLRDLFLLVAFIFFCGEVVIRKTRMWENVQLDLGFSREESPLEIMAREQMQSAEELLLRGETKGAEMAYLKARTLYLRAKSDKNAKMVWENYKKLKKGSGR